MPIPNKAILRIQPTKLCAVCLAVTHHKLSRKQNISELLCQQCVIMEMECVISHTWQSKKFKQGKRKRRGCQRNQGYLQQEEEKKKRSTNRCNHMSFSTLVCLADDWFSLGTKSIYGEHIE